MHALRCLVALLALGHLASAARAGLYFSGETFAELPSQWRGFLVDQRALRMVAAPNAPANPLRKEYVEAAGRLEKLKKERALTADEIADLGAVYLRLGEIGKAIDLLRPAQREHSQHFRIHANLGTAWQLQGDLAQAVLCLEQSAQLAPGKHQKAEEAHLRLVRLRHRQPKDATGLDDLFDVRFVDEKGAYQPGKLAAEQVKKLPAGAVAVVQQLGLWLPADGRLLWLLAELANAHGDVKLAAAIFDGCVTEFGMNDIELRRHRSQTRTAADAVEVKPAIEPKEEHKGHAGPFKPRSRRPLLGRLDLADLPPINADGVTALPWAVLAETQVEGDFNPAFPKYLKQLAGKQVSLGGFMQPLREDSDLAAFMLIEYPVGCWYCEVPEVTGIVLVELAAGKNATFTRNLIKVTGTLTLNATDPERFLFTLSKSRVTEAD
ncbi:MAG: DUF3299 domain-containing protein [Planctomycetia bacterium]|nr:DUF3299 domain-containing protein [Planctomycetia bacterium]